jgi:hypothetical protein
MHHRGHFAKRVGMRNPRGSDHQKTKARLLAKAYGKPCPRCGEPMLKGQDLDLGHSVDLVDDPRSKGDRIEHTHCNRSAGAIDQQKRAKFRHSRDW